MSALSIQPTYPIFTDIDGQPLEAGYVWLGTANLDPQTNPITVYWDAALTILAPQPIRTLAGYPANNDTPARLYVDSDYSIRVMNKNGSVVYSAPTATERYSNAVISNINASQVVYDPAGLNAVATTVQTKLRETVSVKDFGAVGDGVTDDTAAIQAAITASDNVYIPPGTYRCNGQIELRSNLKLTGSGVGVTRIHKVTTTFGGVFVANSNSTTAQLSNITLRDFTLFDDVVGLGFSEQQHLLTFHGVDNVLVDRVEFYGFRGDGLYIGEWNQTIRTRLNTNITVTNCLFDGVNKDNRNGISVITGDRITIANNVFQNVTRSNMPGAIDLEPDASTTSVITNVNISGNRFFNVGGNVGVVGAIIPSNVAEFQNITVTGNTFDTTNTPSITVVHQRITDQTQNISFTGNTSVGTSRSFQFTGATIRGVTISGNTFITNNAALLGFNVTDIVEDVIVSNNTITNGTSSSNGGVAMNGQVKNIVVSGNVFNNWFSFCIRIGGNAGDAISAISIVGNIAQNMRGSGLLAQYSTGTVDGASCVYMNNIGGSSNTSRFWRTDDPGVVSNDNTAVSFNSATLPDSFQPGTSMAIINGDNGVPTTGVLQGTLINVKPSQTGGGFTKWSYQLYYPVNNGVKIGSFFMRKREPSTNAFTAWYEFEGM